jgi:hypothetical protein
MLQQLPDLPVLSHLELDEVTCILTLRGHPKPPAADPRRNAAPSRLVYRREKVHRPPHEIFNATNTNNDKSTASKPRANYCIELATLEKTLLA